MSFVSGDKDIQKQQAKELRQQINDELKNLQCNILLRLTEITYLDSNGEQYGLRFHDDTNGVRYLLYSDYDWKQLLRHLKVTGAVSPSLYMDPKLFYV